MHNGKQARIINETIFIYNLGMIISIDSVLFPDQYPQIVEETTISISSTTLEEETETPSTTLLTTTTSSDVSSTDKVFTFPDFLDVFETTTAFSKAERKNLINSAILFPSRPSENFKVFQELNTGDIVAERFVDKRTFENGAILNPSRESAILNPSAANLKPFGAILKTTTTSSSLGIENLFRKDQVINYFLITIVRPFVCPYVRYV